MSRRREHLGSDIDAAVRTVMARGFSDPRIRGLITVLETRLAPDGRSATVVVSILPEEHEELTMHGLRAAAPHIRRQASEMVRTRTMPELVFKLDKSLKRQAKVLEALAKVREASEGTETP